MSIDFVSVNGLGGAMELGFVQAGMTLRHRAGSLSLGAPVVEGNRPVIGWEWESSFTNDWRDWPRHETPIVMGNPPCSAWSTLTRKDLRGGDAKIMSCTQELIDYAAAVNPMLVVIESVQQAFSTGRAWYQAAREQLVAQTGADWKLTWVMQSNASLGGCSVRKRVFVVFSQIPFGVEWAQPARVARLGDAIRDLEGLELTPSKQPYRRPATWWSVPMRAEDGVDGHFAPQKLQDTYAELIRRMKDVGAPWPVGADTTFALRKLYEHGGEIPMPWAKKLDKHVQHAFALGMNQTGKWDPDEQARVITGSGPAHSVHYFEPRVFTHRECARIQGFPDTWRIWPARNYNKLGAVWGKGVPVHAGRWIAQWARDAVNGTPGTTRGEPIGLNESKIDVTSAYKRTIEVERRWEHQSWVPHEHGHWVDREHEAASCC